MAFTDYQYDVFISYAWVNNPDEVDSSDPIYQWVSRFKRALAARLDERLGRKGAAEFFFDTTEIKKHQDFQPQIEAGVRNSAILVVLLSDGYLNSEACCQEIRLFRQVAGGDPASTGRLFLVPIDETPPDKWPEDFQHILRREAGYPFWARNQSTGRADRLSGDAYHKRLAELRDEMADQLKRMAPPRLQPGQPPVVPAPDASVPTICLAKATPELRTMREDVSTYLKNAGLRVLPTKPYSSDPARWAEALAADLKQAHVFVQLVGESYSDRTDELPQGEEGLQLALAKQSNRLVLQWCDKSVRAESITDESHRALVAGVEFKGIPLIEFEMEIVTRAKRIQEMGSAPTGESNARFALVKADKPDDPVAKEVIRALKASKVNCTFTHNGKPMLERLREVPYAALLVVRVNCSEDWLEKRGDELAVVDLTLRGQAPVRAYYVSDPDPILPYVGRDMLTVIHNDPQSWQRFLEAIQKRGAQS